MGPKSLARRLVAPHALNSLHQLPDVRVGKLSPFNVFCCNELFENASRMKYGPSHTTLNLRRNSSFLASWINTMIAGLSAIFCVAYRRWSSLPLDGINVLSPHPCPLVKYWLKVSITGMSRKKTLDPRPLGSRLFYYFIYFWVLQVLRYLELSAMVCWLEISMLWGQGRGPRIQTLLAQLLFFWIYNSWGISSSQPRFVGMK